MSRPTLAVLARVAAVLLCVAGPSALVLVLVSAFFGVPLSRYRPLINDEVAYWHQALTFSQVGFTGGYYTLDEVTNPSGFTPFGPHGPGFAVLYGTLGSIFGWYRHSVVVLNLVALSLAGWAWASLSRLSTARLLLTGILLTTFWHTLLWAPTGMQEGLHHAGAIAMAALFVSSFVAPARLSITIAGWVVLTVLAFIRPTWIILMPLWAVATLRTRSRAVLTAGIAASILIAAATVVAYGKTTAPYGEGFFFLRAFDLSIGLKSIFDNAASNLERLRMLDQFDTIELIQRAQYWSLLGGTLLATFVAARKTPDWRQGSVLHSSTAAAAMAVAFGGMVMLYQFTNFAEHRMLSIFLLFGALLCAAAPGRLGLVLAGALVVSNILCAPTALQNIEAARRDQFEWNGRELFELHAAVDGKLVHQPAASRWCNTLTTAQYPPHLIAIPAGIGLSVSRYTDHLPQPPRARYLMLDASGLANLRTPHHLDRIATLPYGTLYVNRDVNCH